MRPELLYRLIALRSKADDSESLPTGKSRLSTFRADEVQSIICAIMYVISFVIFISKIFTNRNAFPTVSTVTNTNKSMVIVLTTSLTSAHSILAVI